MWRFGVVLLAFASACIEPTLVLCGDGRACPQGTICMATLQTCVTDEQLSACSELGEGDLCALTTGPGTCIQGACFEPRCGDRIVESGEACDDGNLVAGDGCSSDCDSREACGDGILDTLRAEACDDGNLVSGDGCTSTCEPEILTWRVRQCGEPPGANDDNVAFDVKRNRLVQVSPGWVYEWDGSTWSCTPEMPSSVGDYPYIWTLVYDPSIERVLAFEIGRVRAWDGATWTDLYLGATPTIAAAAFEMKSGQVFTFYPDDSVVNYWSSATHTWTEVNAAVASPIPSGIASGVAYDKPRDEILLLVGNFTAPLASWTWDRKTATWTVHPQPAAWDVVRNPAVTFHEGLSAPVAFGGYTAGGDSSTLFTWDGTVWKLESTAPSAYAREYAAAVYAPASATLLITGGYGPPDVLRYTTTWSQWTQPGLVPKLVSNIASMPPLRALIAVTSDGETWRFDGSIWTRVITTELAPPVITYRPDTQRLVGYESSGRLAEFDGVQWTTVAMDSVTTYAETMAWDPTRGVVMYDGGATYARTANGWEMFAGGVATTPATLGYDYRNQILTLSAGASSSATAFKLYGDTWRDEFSFPRVGGVYHMVELAHRGTLIFVSPMGDGVWETTGDAWRHTSNPIIADINGTGRGVYDLFTGEVVVTGLESRLMLSIGYTNGDPRETCNDGEDADGDGTSACDDDDCWWRCAPTCPPASSCF